MNQVPSVPVLFGGFPFLITIVTWALTIAIRVAFAIGVWRDADTLRRSREGPALVSPFWWTVATLLGGVFVAAVYWVVNRSTLRPGSPFKEAAGEHPDVG
ncbi:hypothetical protein [Tautonia plasticadhaerens]|uniref:Uncharacterized protein n=1 Tax=Tautonia plasticadhaerens TaxID=2527974 RepID=A0A518HEM3_9BACT|nr:hypothetical protein [Tautonia plasticadhaerens]QDV39281.1 hypothetical protein ElP_72450 [Tautonia plasticadhaerens]